MTGDGVQVAQAKLAAATSQLKIMEQMAGAGQLDQLECEKAKGDVAIAEAELQAATENARHSALRTAPATRPAATHPEGDNRDAGLSGHP